MSSISNSMFVVGTILLIHATYSCLHYRSLVQELQESVIGISSDVLETTMASSNNNVGVSVPPLDVYIEVVIGFFIILLSELIRPGSSLQPVVPTADGKRPKPLVAQPYITRDFDIYTTRGHYLSNNQLKQK